MPLTEGTQLERAEDLAERILPSRTPKKRMLVIVNPYASTVSDRLKNLVVYALQARYEVEAIDTEAKDHATLLCREAKHEGYDVVTAFGGDGTINEAANGLIDCDTPLNCLPGGATNVFCRILGIPNDVVDATEHLLRIADDFRPRKVDTGIVNGRHFTFASGIGLDASVVERVDRHPKLKTRLNYWYFTWAALSTFNRRYLVNPPRIRVEAAGRTVEGVTAVVQTTDPFTYFGPRPIRICDPSELDDGTFGMTVLTRATPVELVSLLPRIFSASSERVQRSGHVEGFAGIEGARVTALGKPFPLQMDGDYIGDYDEVTYGMARRSLTVVS